MIFAGRLNISGLEANCSYERTPQLVFPLHPAIEPRQRAHTNMGGTGSADQVREKFYFLYIYSGMSLFYFVSPFFLVPWLSRRISSKPCCADGTWARPYAVSGSRGSWVVQTQPCCGRPPGRSVFLSAGSLPWTRSRILYPGPALSSASVSFSMRSTRPVSYLDTDFWSEAHSAFKPWRQGWLFPRASAAPILVRCPRWAA